MKFSVAALFLLAGYATAGRPELSLTVKDGGHGSVKSALSPTVSFEGESNGMEYGTSVDLSSDDGIPKSFWGQKRSSVKGWNIKTRAEVSQGKYFEGEDLGVYVTVDGNDEDEETFVWASGFVKKGDAQVLKVGAKRVIETDAGKFMVAPRYAFDTSTPTVCLGFKKDDTKAYLTLAEAEKTLLVKQQINEDNSASIKGGCSGFIAATLTNESDLGSTTVTLTEDDIDVEIQKDGWVAGIKSSKSLDSEPAIRFSKSLTFGV
uniref:Uncharacterized protein n=1 Tax=Pseudo-nitzschia australis TaxID=44445 RepID=A0A7S4ABW9_9STRA|mmetsp:Transcript_13796/g.28979  ORF Transcript_13796/g.28979 Transcript_13796/m.28979 type:complete len:262 (+) Transcript_13796:137-922(+)|eukprot:CAMPEP_0168174338 /NCGR_PEP_ID=MMETSP0139_2-20121125/6441_1 /TAXON_ID=44445 /ORGANISM="Pseudo-nitzschia australis, Strain 10249 10 AB" /LENGTH=261 /DNA_ID=CAMNT_0008092463 /DNA_START=135 /DNA_END=920 /DNA_ORIENTATION=-